MTKRRSANGTITFGLAVISTLATFAAATGAQDAVFNKLRQLPDLGACPSSGTPDPDLKQALTTAVMQARAQAKAMLDSVVRMKDAGLVSQETLQQLTDSANKMNQALASADACEAARAYATLLSPAKPAAETGNAPDSAKTDTRNELPRASVDRNKISISTDRLEFGHQSLQTASDAQPITVTNNTGYALTLQALTASVAPWNFQISGCPNAIADSQQCTFNVKFTPFQAKPKERYVALVPSQDSQVFDSLRQALNQKQGRADALEKAWTVAARCEAHHGSDCPAKGAQVAGQPEQRTSSDQPRTPATTIQPAATKELCRQPAEALKTYAPGTVYACWQDARDEAGRAEQYLRSQFQVVTLDASADPWKFPFTRAVVGLDMSAPTSRTVKQSYFVDFDLIAPIRVFTKNEDPLENRVWLWLNPRITSLPQATNFSTVSTIDETGSFFQSVSGGTVDKIANGLDVSGGLEFALVKPRDGIPWWGEYPNSQARLALSWIVGGGLSTPFSTDSTEVQSAVTQAICDAFKAPAGQTISNSSGLVCQYNGTNTTPSIVVDANGNTRDFIDFYTPDRSRFFRRFYTGLRFKTFYFSRDVHSRCQPFEGRPSDEGDCNAPYDIFPGIIDLTVGQDEAVTRGKFNGVLFRVEGVYPLPWYQGIHIFGTIYTKLQGQHSPGQPFSPYTIQAPPAGGATDVTTFRFALPPLDRDYFRIGIGVDLIQVFKKTGQPSKNAPAAPAGAKAPS